MSLSKSGEIVEQNDGKVIGSFTIAWNTVLNYFVTGKKGQNAVMQKQDPYQSFADHPAECGKKIRSYHAENDRPWGSIGIIFGVLRNNFDGKLISINRSRQTPADWTTIIVAERDTRRWEKCNESAIRGQSTSNYSTTS